MSSVLHSCCSSAYIFTKKRTPSEENFNNYTKILITPILYRGTTHNNNNLEPVEQHKKY